MGCAASKTEVAPLDTQEGSSDAPVLPTDLSKDVAACSCELAISRLMPGGPLPADEEHRRLKSLLDCRVLDTPDERRYDAITSILASVFKVPVAVVGLIDEGRLWFKSIQGMEARTGDRLHSFCNASLRLPCPTMMVVPDTLTDSRFQHNQFVVNPPFVRFYAGAPLVSSEGLVLGSLAVLDIKPRTIPAEVACLITNFAELVVRELEKDKVALLRQRKAEAHTALVRALSAFDEAVALCDVRGKGWPIRFANGPWCTITGTPEAGTHGAGLWSTFHFASAAQTAQMLYAHAAIEEHKPFALHLVPGPADTSFRQPGAAVTPGIAASPSAGPLLTLEFRPATADHLSESYPHIGIPGFVAMGMQQLAPGEEPVAIPDSLYFAVIKHATECAQHAQQLGQAAEQPWEPPVRLSFGAQRPPAVRQLHLPVREDGAPSEAEPPTPMAEDEPAYAEPFSPSVGSPHDHSVRSGAAGAEPWSPLPYGQEPPEGLGDVTLGPLVGRGEHGKVYRGTWRTSKVAVKIVDCFTTTGPDDSQDTDPKPVLEAMLSKGVGQHPNLVQTLEFAVRKEPQEMMAGKQHSQVWIIEEYCDKGTLRDAIDRGWLRTSPKAGAPVDLRSVLLTAQDIASAVAHLHSKNVLHGDLACGNVLLCAVADDPRGFSAKVSDFGLSRLIVTLECETASMGTCSHMPPELMEGGLLSRATDGYSFGVLCWEMYTGRHAWGGWRVARIIHAKTVLRETLSMPDDCPPAFKELVESCLVDDHTQRPSFPNILAALGNLLSELGAASQG